ncbi:hypothetical protein MKZ38_007441 [Zalerion maritima]|uniref:Uncharacterized protein n=1 Tax=Zalerion maritima TaxID=339359 RepID=A0AAD5RUU9_9PEZI|nr:hypothetical protein MKZ38_007441 [Zalerion maritima]
MAENFPIAFRDDLLHEGLDIPFNHIDAIKSFTQPTCLEYHSPAQSHTGTEFSSERDAQRGEPYFLYSLQANHGHPGQILDYILVNDFPSYWSLGSSIATATPTGDNVPFIHNNQQPIASSPREDLSPGPDFFQRVASDLSNSGLFCIKLFEESASLNFDMSVTQLPHDAGLEKACTLAPGQEIATAATSDDTLSLEAFARGKHQNQDTW